MSLIKSRLGSTAVMAAGAAYAGCGLVQIVHSQRGAGEDVVGVAGYLSLSFFAVALILSAALFLILGERARTDKGAIAAGIGVVALGVTCISSVINSHDLPFFVVVAPITNALWLFGSIALAVSLKRAGSVPRWVYLGLPLIWVGGIPLSTFGGGLISAAYLLAVGYLLSDGVLETVEPAPATA
jgi:hypothetical protein